MHRFEDGIPTDKAVVSNIRTLRGDNQYHSESCWILDVESVDELVALAHKYGGLAILPKSPTSHTLHPEEPYNTELYLGYPDFI